MAGIKKIALSVIAASAAASLAVAPAAAKERSIVVNFGKDGDLLKQLIDLDQEGIEDMRAELADARAEIADAIDEIDEARNEVKGLPGGGIILKIAFVSARAGASIAVDEALADARREIDKAESILEVADIGADERLETQGAIDALRTELDALTRWRIRWTILWRRFAPDAFAGNEEAPPWFFPRLTEPHEGAFAFVIEVPRNRRNADVFRHWGG